jgi:hypothetical protein
MFKLDGIIHDDSAFSRLKNEYIRLLISEMRLSGYVPRYDINPDFTTAYNELTKYFEFELSIHGVYVGKKKAEWIAGIDGTTVVFTQKSKSDVYLQDLA